MKSAASWSRPSTPSPSSATPRCTGGAGGRGTASRRVSTPPDRTTHAERRISPRPCTHRGAPAYHGHDRKPPTCPHTATSSAPPEHPSSTSARTSATRPTCNGSRRPRRPSATTRPSAPRGSSPTPRSTPPPTSAASKSGPRSSRPRPSSSRSPGKRSTRPRSWARLFASGRATGRDTPRVTRAESHAQGFLRVSLALLVEHP
ncbi:hypothetical protein GMYAFLOJ_CDS0058 [Microbacterium phage phiMiGM15]